MGISYSPSIIADGLVLHLDAANMKSYPGSGNTVLNLVSQTVYPSVSLFGDTSLGSISNGVVNLSGLSNNSSSGVILRGTGSLGDTINNDFTSIGWLYRTSSKSGEVLSYREVSVRCAFDVVDNALIFYQRESISPFTIRSTFVSVNNSLNTWYCFALTKAGSTWSFYRNGSLIGANTFTMTETITGTAFHIGGAWSDDDFLSNCMDGSVGPVMHYTRALTSQEITQNFNAIRSRYGI